jgi:regulator of cell morphogenesis and NO signaling
MHVFRKYQVDFAFHGQTSLSEAAAKAGVDAEHLLAEIDAVRPPGPQPVSWLDRPIAELILHLVEEHHAQNRERVPRALDHARQVAARFAASYPELGEKLVPQLVALQQDLDVHLLKEERVLFPWMLAPGADPALQSLRDMHGDHDDLQRILQRIRRYTRHFTPPEEADGRWRSLYRELEALDFDLQVHVHLENNVLFPLVVAARAGTPRA